VGAIRLFATRRGIPREALAKLRRSELALNYIEDTVGQLTVLSPRIGIPPADWNVQSTRAQLALGRVLTALERAEPWPESAAHAEAHGEREWQDALMKATKEVRTVAALAAALCSRHMAPGDRWRTESTIASEVPQLIAELGRVRAFLHGAVRPHPHPPEPQ
jgi:hypothetical protein